MDGVMEVKMMVKTWDFFWNFWGETFFGKKCEGREMVWVRREFGEWRFGKFGIFGRRFLGEMETV